MGVGGIYDPKTKTSRLLEPDEREASIASARRIYRQTGNRRKKLYEEVIDDLPIGELIPQEPKWGSSKKRGK